MLKPRLVRGARTYHVRKRDSGATTLTCGPSCYDGIFEIQESVKLPLGCSLGYSLGYSLLVTNCGHRFVVNDS